MNTLLYGLALALASLSAPQGTARGDNLVVRINGAPASFEAAQPVIWYSKLLVPLKDVMEELGGSTRWSSRTNTIRARLGNRTANLKIGSQVAAMDDRDVWLDVAPRTVNGTTMVPLNFFEDAFGATVRWNSSTRVAAIDTTGRRRGGASTASLNDSDTRRTDQDRDRRTETQRDADARRQYHSRIVSAEDAQLSADYDRFLTEQDFRRYQTDRAGWIEDYQDYRRGLLSNGSRGDFKPSSSYDQFLRDRDFELYSNNQVVWRANYQRFTQWRRTLNTTRMNANFQQYMQDRKGLASQTSDLDRSGQQSPSP